MAANNTSTAGIAAAKALNVTPVVGVLALALAAVAWLAGSSVAPTLAGIGVAAFVATLGLVAYVLFVIRFVHGVPTRFEA